MLEVKQTNWVNFALSSEKQLIQWSYYILKRTRKKLTEKRHWKITVNSYQNVWPAATSLSPFPTQPSEAFSTSRIKTDATVFPTVKQMSCKIQSQWYQHFLALSKSIKPINLQKHSWVDFWTHKMARHFHRIVSPSQFWTIQLSLEVWLKTKIKSQLSAWELMCKQQNDHVQTEVTVPWQCAWPPVSSPHCWRMCCKVSCSTPWPFSPLGWPDPEMCKSPCAFHQADVTEIQLLGGTRITCGPSPSVPIPTVVNSSL